MARGSTAGVPRFVLEEPRALGIGHMQAELRPAAEWMSEKHARGHTLHREVCIVLQDVVLCVFP